MYSNDKITQSIADAVRKVMEEELKGNQHKIDANKNDKIDAHDFELLRKKKKVEEKVVNPYAVGMAAAMKSTGDKPPLKKSTIVKAHDIAKKVDEEVELDEAATRKEVKKVYSKKGNHIGTIYHVDNGKDKPFISAQYHHGGGAVDNRAKSHEDAEKSIHSSHEATVRNAKNRHAEAKKEYESTSKHLKSIPEEVQLSFSDLLESYKTGGLKSFFENFEVDVVEEEATSDEFVAELEKAKRKAAGKEKNEVAKAAVQAVQQEEVDQLDELSKNTLASYIGKAAVSLRKPNIDIARGTDIKKNIDKVNKREDGIHTAAKKLTKEEVEQIDEKSEKDVANDLVKMRATVDHHKDVEVNKHKYGSFAQPRFRDNPAQLKAAEKGLTKANKDVKKTPVAKFLQSRKGDGKVRTEEVDHQED